MNVNKNESMNSVFDSLEEWLNDENRIVRITAYILNIYTIVIVTVTAKHDGLTKIRRVR